MFSSAAALQVGFLFAEEPEVILEIIPVIMAAGEGKRMGSPLAKVLHEADGVPMVRRVMAAAALKGAQKPVVIVGHGADQVMAQLGDEVRYAFQREQLGTGHAVLCAREYFEQADGLVLVLAGDMPLLTKKTIESLVAAAKDHKNAVTLLSAKLEDPTGYGRILREDGRLVGIVEQKDATEEQRAIREVNASVYCFDSKALLEALSSLTADNAQGEYYLTDCVAHMVKSGLRAEAICAADPTECMGVNTPDQLRACSEILKKRRGG